MSQTEADVHQELENRLRFETLLSDISVHFINLPFNLIDSAIENAQRQICQCLGLDMSVLWQWSVEKPRFLYVSHLYGPLEGPAIPEYINGEESFPWTYQKILNGETVTISTEQLPPEAAQDQATRRHYGAKSSIVIPLAAGGKPIIGVLSFDTLFQDYIWSEESVKRFQLVALVFCNALVRKHTEEVLNESTLRLDLAAKSAGAGIWELDCRTGIFWATAQARKIFGYSTDEEISMEGFERLIHAEDLSRVRQSINLAMKNRQEIDVEYRILADDGHLKWICSKGRPYFDADGKPIRLLGISIDINERKRLELELNRRLEEVESLTLKLENENHYLREDLRTELGFEKIIGHSKKLKAVLLAAKQVASTDATVLVLGETGTGKGLIAHAIHQMSARKDKSFITVNCAALPHNLIESELFGREKGAFTGADIRQNGRFEVANRGTIFLDEIGEMPLELQAKLLRVLQDGEFERLGCPKTIKVDVRVISATARDLKEQVRNGSFREDLFYRLNVFPVTLPPLRQRVEDIPQLTQYFMEKYTKKFGSQIDSIPNTVLKKLMHYDWPGNIRELEHLIEKSVIISPGRSLILDDKLDSSIATPSPNEKPKKDLAAVERSHILQILQSTDWRIEGADGAAAILGLHPSTMRYRLKKLGIRRPS